MQHGVSARVLCTSGFVNASWMCPGMQGPKLEGGYAHQVGLSELRVLSSGTTAGTVLKLAMDLKDGDEVAVRLMTRGPGVRSAHCASLRHCRGGASGPVSHIERLKC